MGSTPTQDDEGCTDCFAFPRRRFNKDAWTRLLVRRGVVAPTRTTEQYRNGKGELRFKGLPALKTSQEYPRQFGRQVPQH